MKKIILYFGFLLSTISFSNTMAEEIPRIFIFHINGVNTTNSEAVFNLSELRAVANIRSNIIKWDFLYNATHGLLTADLLDVMRMKIQEGKTLTIDDYVLTYMKRSNLDYPINSKMYNELKDRIKMEYIRDLEAFGSRGRSCTLCSTSSSRRNDIF